MTNQFTNGYALLIAVNENSVPKWALPVVGKDVRALEGVLTHPERCAYAQENVRVVSGIDATGQGIRDGLTWLTERLSADNSGDATAVLYYSGHGWRDTNSSSPTYYIIPYDIREDDANSTALRAADLATAVEGLTPRRLLVILDCCHAGGIDVKDIDLAGMEANGATSAAPGYVSCAIPSGLFMSVEKAVALEAVDKGSNLLAQGAGRVVLSSSQGDQSSYVRKDDTMSIFTYHLIEALTGHPQPAEGAGEVLMSDVMSHVTRHVYQSALDDYGQEQTPDFRISGNFAVALLLGGTGLSKGMDAPDPLEPHAPTDRAGTRIDTDGGAYMAGDVATQGGNFIGRDHVVQGDEVHGPKITIIESPHHRHEHQPDKFQVPSVTLDYVPRTSVEETLSACLQTECQDIHVVGLSGLPGVGKSQIARFVASKLRGRYHDGILWADLQQKSETSILGHFISTFDPSFHPSTIQNVDRYVEELRKGLKDKKVLIILENVENENAAAKARRVIEAGDQKTVFLLIYRTRWPGLEGPGEYSEVHVRAMSSEEARLLFRKLWEDDSRLKNVDDETIEQLAEELFYMSAGMASVAREIRLQARNPKEHLEQLRQRKQADDAAGTKEFFGLEAVYSDLPKESKQLLPFLGVLGDSPWELDALATISRLRPDQVETGLRQLIALGLVGAEEPTYNTPRYRVERVVKELAAAKLRKSGGSPLESMAQALMADYYLQAVQRTLLQYRGQLLSEFLADEKRMARFVQRLSQLLPSSTPDAERPSPATEPSSEQDSAPAGTPSLLESQAAQYFGAIDLDPFQDTFENMVLADSFYDKKWYDYVHRARIADQKPHVRLCMERALEQENWPLLQSFAPLNLGRILVESEKWASVQDSGWLDFALVRSVNLRNEDLSSSTQWATRMVDSKCTDCEFVSAHWYGAHLHRVTLRDIRMVAAVMPGLVVSNSRLSNVDARSADLRGALFYHCDLDKVNFRHANLAGAALINCRISEKVDFGDTTLRKAAEETRKNRVTPDQSVSIVSEDTILQHWFLDYRRPEQPSG